MSDPRGDAGNRQPGAPFRRRAQPPPGWCRGVAGSRLLPDRADDRVLQAGQRVFPDGRRNEQLAHLVSTYVRFIRQRSVILTG